jgi:hypothetical protein
MEKKHGEVIRSHNRIFFLDFMDAFKTWRNGVLESTAVILVISGAARYCRPLFRLICLISVVRSRLNLKDRLQDLTQIDRCQRFVTSLMPGLLALNVSCQKIVYAQTDSIRQIAPPVLSGGNFKRPEVGVYTIINLDSSMDLCI